MTLIHLYVQAIVKTNDFIDQCISHDHCDEDELANSELLYVLPDEEDLNSPVPTYSWWPKTAII